MRRSASKAKCSAQTSVRGLNKRTISVSSGGRAERMSLPLLRLQKKQDSARFADSVRPVCFSLMIGSISQPKAVLLAWMRKYSQRLSARSISSRRKGFGTQVTLIWAALASFAPALSPDTGDTPTARNNPVRAVHPPSANPPFPAPPNLRPRAFASSEGVNSRMFGASASRVIISCDAGIVFKTLSLLILMSRNYTALRFASKKECASSPALPVSIVNESGKGVQGFGHLAV